MAVYTAEPGSPTHDALNLLASWAAISTRPRQPAPWTSLDRQRRSPFADPGYGTGFTGHGTIGHAELGFARTGDRPFEGRWSWSQ